MALNGCKCQGVGWRQDFQNCQVQPKRQSLGLVLLAWPTMWRLEGFAITTTLKVWGILWRWIKNQDGCGA